MRTKLLLTLFTITVLSLKLCISQTIADKIKDKTLIVVIPDETAKIYSNMMDAIQDNWKISSYKFMSTQDAKKLYSDNSYIFLHLVSETSKGFEKKIYLKLNKGWEIGALYSYIILEEQGVDNSTTIPDEVEEQMYFHICHFIWDIKQTSKLRKVKTKEGAVTYYGLSKKSFDNKKTLLMERNSGPEETIKENLNRHDLNILSVNYSELETALRKKDKDVMVSINGSTYSCDEFEPLFVTPIFTAEELAHSKKITKIIYASGTALVLVFVSVITALIIHAVKG